MITINWVLSFIGEILSKIHPRVLEKSRIFKEESILPPFQWDLPQ